MKIVLVVLLSLLQIVPSSTTDESARTIRDPVFEMYAPSFAEGLSFENVPLDGWQPLVFPHEWYYEQIILEEPFSFGYYKGNVEWDGKGLLFLKFPAVNFKARLWVNGKPAGTHLGGYLPFEFNLTELLVQGSNEVILGVQDVSACFKPETKLLNKFALGVASAVFPFGSAPLMAGMWMPSEIIRRPETYIEGIWINTSVNQHSICVSVDAVAPDKFHGDHRIQVDIETLEGDRVLSLGQKVFEISRDGGKVELSSEWDNPRLWSPDSPNLYNAVIKLKRNGDVIDTATERFGFREFTIRGSDFFLNGTKIHLRACSKHIWPMDTLIDKYAENLIDEVKSLNANTLRLHANPFPEEFLDVADEKGLLIVNESSVWTMGRVYNLNSDLFWANVKNTWDEHIKRDYNHPSWVIASVENELLLTGGAIYDNVPDRLGRLGEYVREMSGRCIMFEGDDDPNGCADIYNLHYCHEPNAHHTYPQDAFFFDGEFICQSRTAGPYTWKRDKPMYMGEFLWLPNPLYTTSVVLGDSSLEDINRYKNKAKSILFEHYVSAFRILGVSAMNPWNPLESGGMVADTTRELFKPIRFFVIQHDVNHFGGKSLERTIHIQNWSEKPHFLHFEWEFAGDSGDWSGIMNPSENYEFSISTKTPDVEKKMEFLLKMTLKSDGEVVHRESPLVFVYPNHFDALRFALVDPVGSFARSLGEAGFQFDMFETAQEAKDRLPLLIAPNALSKKDSLTDIPADCIILYPQDSFMNPPLDTLGTGNLGRMVQQNGFTATSWVSDMGGFMADELMTYFAGDNIIAPDAFRLTNGIPSKPILCTSTGWSQYYPIVEIPSMGIFSTVAIEQKLSSEPRCGIILAELVKYLYERDADNEYVPLVSHCDSPDKLRALGFSPLEEFDKDAVHFFDSDCNDIDLSEYSAGSTIILDRLDDDVLDSMGIDVVYSELPRKALGMIPMVKSVIPHLTRYMIANACDYQFGFHSMIDILVSGSYTNMGKARIRKVSADGYKSSFIIKDLCVVLTSDTKPNIIINNIHWDRHWNHPLATILLELGVKATPRHRICFSFEETQHLVKIDGDEVAFLSSGIASGSFEVERDSDVTLSFLTRQDKAGDEPAHVVVYVDEKRIGSLDVENESYEPKLVNFHATKGIHTLKAVFANDHYVKEKGEDRNLFIKQPELFMVCR